MVRVRNDWLHPQLVEMCGVIITVNRLIFYVIGDDHLERADYSVLLQRLPLPVDHKLINSASKRY